MSKHPPRVTNAYAHGCLAFAAAVGLALWVAGWWRLGRHEYARLERMR